MYMIKAPGIAGRAIDFALLFVYIYAIIFNYLPFAASKLILLFLIVKMILLPGEIPYFKNKVFLYTMLVGGLFIVYFYFITNLTEYRHYGFLFQTVYYFIEGIYGTYLMYIYLIGRYDAMYILKMIFYVICFQSIIIMITFLNDAFREFTFSLMPVIDPRQITTARLRGLSNSGGAGLSYLQSLGVFVGSYLILDKNEKNVVQKIVLITGITVITVSLLFVARTGLIFSCIFILALILQNAINNNMIKTLFKQTIYLVVVGLSIYHGYKLLVPASKVDVLNERVFSRSFELLSNYQETGSVGTESTDILAKMYIYPDKTRHLIFGKGLWDSPGDRKASGRWVDSDVGFVRLIFATGIVGTLLFYSIYVVYLLSLKNSIVWKVFPIGILCLIIIFVSGEFKEPFLVRGSGVIRVLFLMAFVFVNIPIKTNEEI